MRGMDKLIDDMLDDALEGCEITHDSFRQDTTCGYEVFGSIAIRTKDPSRFKDVFMYRHDWKDWFGDMCEPISAQEAIRIIKRNWRTRLYPAKRQYKQEVGANGR